MGTAYLWNCEIKRCSNTKLRFYPNFPAVALDNLLADSQSSTSPGRPSLGGQALENLKDAIEVLAFYANAIVMYAKNPFMVLYLFLQYKANLERVEKNAIALPRPAGDRSQNLSDFG